MKKVLNTVYSTKEYLELYSPLLENGFSLDFNFLAHTQDEEAVINAVRGYNYVIAGSEIWSRRVFLNSADCLKMLVRHGIGMDNVDIEAADDLEIAVSNTPGANAKTVAEHALAMLLCLIRRINIYDAQIKQNIWNVVITPSLTGTVGLIGFGAIAREFARMLSVFHVKILAYDINKDEEAADELGVTYVSLEDLIKESDYISLHVPAVKETIKMVNDKFISQMKENAIIINTGRGNLIDEDALFNALNEKRISGAALDVFQSEPLIHSSPLRSLDNIILTPHAASAGTEGLKAIVKRCVSNILKFDAGEKFYGLIVPRL